MKLKYLKYLILIALPALTPLNSASADGPPEADRKAILAMAGEFEVFFNFRETVALAPDYQVTKPYEEDAFEVVLVTEDSGDRIVLQHILTTGNGNRVVKHWKQIWTWEDTRLTEFQGRQKWRIRELPAEKVRGTWTQQVTQVDDSPRYESFGQWKHEGGYSRWQSRLTNRPLPRREHTKRSDYQVVRAVNRHGITPHGWVHYQDNLKLVLKENGDVSHYLAEETGLNHYDRISDHDFSPATDYWAATQSFWGLVSDYWESVQNERDHFEILKEVEGVSLTGSLFEIASAIQDGKREVPTGQKIANLINPYLK